MLASKSDSLFEMVVALPVKQRQQLARKAEFYRKVLDKAIASILAPSIGRADDQFLVADAVIPLYGVGSTPQEAMEDYRSVVVEYYEGLEAEADELAPILRSQLDVLRQVFEPLEKVV